MKSAVKYAFTKINSFLNKKEIACLYNVFNRTYERKVLVSYIVAPFTVGISDNHTNYTECYTACEIFDELGFIVDVVDYNKYDEEIDYKTYAVIYGFGESFERLFHSNNYFQSASKIKKIIYGTGCDTVFSNKISLERVAEFFEKEKLLCISSARLAPATWRCQIVFADLIIALGNSFVVSTYKQYNINRVEPLNIFFKSSCLIDLSKKDFTVSKSNFLWWGSAGAIHKGLDLILQLFARRSDIKIFVCGYRNEFPFDDYLMQMMSKNLNIIDLGFVQVGSSQHVRLLDNCVATLLPSASEGGSPGIVNACGNAGLIPIITKNCGVDVPDETQQFVLDELNVESLEIKIDLLLSLDVNVIKDISVATKAYFQREHEFACYKSRLKNLIAEAVN